ncbi:MAG TPA: alkaline phosphatase family protein [Planktothrix sp.]
MEAFDKTAAHDLSLATSSRHPKRARCMDKGSISNMTRLTTLWLAAILLLVSPWCQSVSAQNSGGQPPKLVLLIVADQFSYNFISRYHDRFANGGFKLLEERGANFVECKYQDCTTQTAVGHSVIASGAYPWLTGIVADRWQDTARGKPTTATTEEGLQLVGGAGEAAGTKYMQGTTIGDQMKLATNGRSKVFTVGLRPEASLILAGRLANNGYWWDTRTGTFVTSSMYGHDLPGWVQSFNDQRYSEKFIGKPWQRLLPEEQYGASTRDDYPHERGIAGDGKEFPHTLGAAGASPSEAFYNAFTMTPWANQMVVDFAREAIEREGLGQHTDTDMLGLCLGAGEPLGQSFGPYSQETEDLCLRMDQSLATLFQYIDQKLGLDNCLVVFTSDHGVMPIPEFLKERGMDGGRIDAKVFKQLLNSALSSRLGQGEWIESFEPPNLYLNANAIAKEKFRQPDVEQLAAKLSHSVPGIGEAYAAFQFYTNQLPNGPFLDRVRKSYYWGRSGELYILPKPGYIFSSELNGTVSGSPYNYDSHVPLFIMGCGVRAGKYAAKVSPADIAPTIAAVMGIDPPSLCEGSAISECLPAQSSPHR